jgi:hypothetical protein
MMMTPKAQASARRRARARQGSATVELLVLMPLFILLMAVSFWAMQLYETKITSMKAVRGPVFTQATLGCGNPGSTSFEPPASEDTSSFERQDDSEAAPSTPDGNLDVVSRKLANAPGAEVIDRAVGSRGARIVRPVAVNGIVGVSTHVSGQTSMTCNESVHDGDAKAIKQVAGSSFDPRSP